MCEVNGPLIRWSHSVSVCKTTHCRQCIVNRFERGTLAAHSRSSRCSGLQCDAARVSNLGWRENL